MPVVLETDGRKTWTCLVYVIELDHAACQHRDSPCGEADCGRVPVYVGQTATTAPERFAQHKRGERSSRRVRQHGRSLRPDLSAGLDGLTRDAAVLAEAQLGDQLREAGYCVYGAH